MTKTETQNEVQRYATLLEKYVKGASMPDFQEDMVLEAAGHLRRLDAENKAHKADVMSFHYAMKDAGWHPGRTDDLLTDIIRAKGKELIQLHAENSGLREALERARSWMDRQGDSQSGGNHATFDLMMLREERDAITMALQDAPVAPDCDRDDCDKYGCTGACDPDAAMAANAAPADMPASFGEWFYKNYPSDTIIADPVWHARSIFRMAQAHARLAAKPLAQTPKEAE